MSALIQHYAKCYSKKSKGGNLSIWEKIYISMCVSMHILQKISQCFKNHNKIYGVLLQSLVNAGNNLL